MADGVVIYKPPLRVCAKGHRAEPWCFNNGTEVMGYWCMQCEHEDKIARWPTVPVEEGK